MLLFFERCLESEPRSFENEINLFNLIKLVSPRNVWSAPIGAYFSDDSEWITLGRLDENDVILVFGSPMKFDSTYWYLALSKHGVGWVPHVYGGNL